MKNEQRPPVTKPPRPASQQKFNYEVSLDAFEVHDAAGHRHTVLSMVDTATKYHVGQQPHQLQKRVLMP